MLNAGVVTNMISMDSLSNATLVIHLQDATKMTIMSVEQAGQIVYTGVSGCGICMDMFLGSYF